MLCTIFAGDSLAPHNEMQFSTYEFDNDLIDGNCAVLYQGAWWYQNCHRANLNGLYLNGSTTVYAKGIVWYSWRGYYYSLKKTEIKIRRLQ